MTMTLILQNFYYLCNFFAPNFIVNRISSALRTPLFLEDFIFEKFENIFEKFENIFEKFENTMSEQPKVGRYRRNSNGRLPDAKRQIRF